MTKTSSYTCTCDPSVRHDDVKRINRGISVELPAWSEERSRRIKYGLTSAVSIDECIVESIKILWRRGIETEGCCCGHGIERAWVQVAPESCERMAELGYEQRPVESPAPGVVHGEYAFYL